MKKENVIEWTELLFHAQNEGFCWNYAHEILRAFQLYDRPMKIYCDEINDIIPLNDPYIHSKFKSNANFYKSEQLNQMGRDIVYSFMQKYNVKEMLVVLDT